MHPRCFIALLIKNQEHDMTVKTCLWILVALMPFVTQSNIERSLNKEAASLPKDRYNMIKDCEL